MARFTTSVRLQLEWHLCVRRAKARLWGCLSDWWTLELVLLQSHTYLSGLLTVTQARLWLGQPLGHIARLCPAGISFFEVADGCVGGC